jgi:hypothetical protein
MKKARTKAAKKTQILIVPVVEGARMDRVLRSVAAATGKCGKCDRIAGVTWCNVDVPKRRYTISLTKPR